MMKKAVPIALICLAQAGCSVIDTNPIYGDDGFIRDRSQDYEGAVESKMLEVPAELNSKMIVDQMAIPAVASVSSIKPNEFEVPRPIFFYPQSTSDRVDVERIDGERRVVVDEPPALVFATLKDFWRDNAVEIDRADKHTGYLETEWIVAQVEGEQSFVDRWLSKLNLASGSLNQRDKFRLDVQPVAGNPARTSIALEHARSFSADDDTQAVWDGEATQVAYKSEMMFEMLRYLSNAIESENVPTLSEHLQSKAPAKVMGRDSRGQPVLKVEGSVDDVWNKVHAALKTDRFDLGTIDR
ncbi:MAG: outer membrane protein assembly factor BamC, partial [Pontibacterium sp.]